MSEQKYYVLLKNLTGQPIPIQLCRFGFCGELVDFAKPKLARGNYFLKGPTQRFTKSELAEIMDGAFYRKPFLGETGVQPEWINPLIELVPVEEVEK
ncbi:hypothetical protein [Pseudolactococcus piscium]|uniref:Uncharacterized protein n=1 Tax=Pseudolactococcus piscium MKFS47 TaxID=297352 RepID=A0A0D6DYV8_9LACT|nr:hypothetical protein [Lactococcus piscium]CEN29154.1 Uncharacterized protein LACPI_1954 [Lactococcus piscium MKFS47]